MFKYNRWQQRNEPIIQTKLSHIPRLKKSVKTETEEHKKLNFFTVRKALYSKIITIIDNFVEHKN